MITIEASLIIPIILIIVMVQMFFGLFLIDMSVAKSETLRLADEATDVWKTDGKLIDGTYNPQQLLIRNKNFLRHNTVSRLSDKIKARLTKRISSRLNRSSISKSSVESFGDKVSVRVSICFAVPLWGSREYAGVSGWTFHCRGKAVLSNEEEILRKELSKNFKKQ